MFVFEDCSLSFLYIFLGENDGIKVMKMLKQLGGSTTHQQPPVYEFNQIPRAFMKPNNRRVKSSENVVYRGSSPVILIIYIRADPLC